MTDQTLDDMTVCYVCLGSGKIYPVAPARTGVPSKNSTSESYIVCKKCVGMGMIKKSDISSSYIKD